MSKRALTFAEGEYYHVYNRGVDKRDIFMDKEDLFRFLKCLQVLNTVEPIGSLYEFSFKEVKQNKSNSLGGPASKLVEIVCFCLNPNHYHLLLKQEVENGISLFMQRLGTAHVMYFNEKYDRTGTLFGGRFKAVHVKGNTQLLHLSAYINLNFEVHGKWEGTDNPMTFSSMNEYTGDPKVRLCSKEIILDQFSSKEEYKKYVHSSLADIKKRKQEDKEWEQVFLE